MSFSHKFSEVARDSVLNCTVILLTILKFGTVALSCTNFSVKHLLSVSIENKSIKSGFNFKLEPVWAEKRDITTSYKGCKKLIRKMTFHEKYTYDMAI